MLVNLPEWAQFDGKNIILRLYIQPGARQTALAGTHDGALKIRLAAPPVEGKANAALIIWLSKTLQKPQRSVVLIAGELSRHKRIAIEVHTNELESTIQKLIG
jgi:uncharacterized protein